MFIQNAYAQEAAPPGGGMAQLVILVGLFAIMWFFMIAPQRKRMKEHRAMVMALKKGDEVMTGGGMMGRIVALDEQAIDLEIAKNTVVRFHRNFVTQVLPKGSLKGELSSPVVAANDNEDDAEKSS